MGPGKKIPWVGTPIINSQTEGSRCQVYTVNSLNLVLRGQEMTTEPETTI